MAGLPTATFGQAALGLDKCQKTAAKEAVKYVSGKTKAITNCLQRISKELIKENSATPADVAKSCAAQFRKLVNTEDPDKTLAAAWQIDFSFGQLRDTAKTTALRVRAVRTNF